MALVLTGDGQITADNFTVATNGNTSVGGTLGVTGTTTNTGLITASAGVAIGGTGAVNTLDDYEEGTFTPFLNSLSQNPTYSDQVGRYTKIGRMCNIYIRLTTSTFNGGTGLIKLGGLPFTAASTGNPYYIGSVFALFGFEDYASGLIAQVNPGANTLDIYEMVPYAGSNYIAYSNTHVQNNGAATFMMTICLSYEV